MIWTKPFDVTIHALHLDVTPEVFGKEWRACVEDHSRDLTSIITMLQPYFKHWVNLLTNPEYPRDIQIAALYKIGYTESYNGLDKVADWVKRQVDLQAELEYIACEFLRFNTFYPKVAKGAKIEYVFALLFRQYLCQHIKLARQEKDICTDDDNLLCSETVDPTEQDILLLKQIPKNRWEKYLLYLVYNGFNSLEIAEITRIPRETLYYEELTIWDKIKTLWQKQGQ